MKKFLIVPIFASILGMASSAVIQPNWPLFVLFGILLAGSLFVYWRADNA